MEYRNMAVFKLLWTIFLLLTVRGEEFHNATEQNATVLCPIYHEYYNFDIRTAMGKWQAVELYTHLSREGVKMIKTCPKITIWETEESPQSTYGPSTDNQLFHVQHINAKFRQEYRYLRLLWDEAGQTIEYSLYFRNDSAGYWQSFQGQNGTLTTRPAYQQFSGTVQVLKAVNDHLVLNFCQEATANSPAQLYSVLFYRDAGKMVAWEIDSVHALLQNKKLSVASRRMVCGNSAGKIMHNLLYLFISCLFTYLIKSS